MTDECLVEKWNRNYSQDMHEIMVSVALYNQSVIIIEIIIIINL